ncbi:MAG: T9SS type A sorting domain-containing protein [Candidatus Neomarinimicrobiota bacterium]
MKLKSSFITALVSTLSLVYSQLAVKPLALANESGPANSNIYPVTGSDRLRAEESRILDYRRTHPEVAARLSAVNRSAWNFEVGSQHTWWATDLDISYEEYEVPATCRAVGVNCYIFVEDAVWLNGSNPRVDLSAVQSILNAFDSATPADANKGIYQIATETFGAAPDVDGDPKIMILILDIKDGFTGSGGYVAGYFFSINEYADGDPAIEGHRSNQTEIYYLDADPANLLTDYGVENGMATAAHEFQHMIHWNYDDWEWTFINEGCATVSEVVCGYPIYSQSLYAGETDIHLFDWRHNDDNVLNDYSRSARWTLYLYEQFPNDYLRLLVNDTKVGITGIESALSNYAPATTRRFDDILIDWIVANYVDDPSIDSKYGYNYSPLARPEPTFDYYDTNVSLTTNSISSLGAHYIKFSRGTSLDISFNCQRYDLVIKAYKSAATTVDDIILGQSYSFDGLGSEYSSVTFMVINTNENMALDYSFSSTGAGAGEAIEIVYEDGQPEGYLPLPPGDTVAVFFNGIPGSILDSVKVAFRNAGQIDAVFARYEDSWNPSPVGTVFWGPTLVVQRKISPVPYPVPYENWNVIDVSAEKLPATEDFIVALAIKDTTKPGVMVSAEAIDGVYHSMAYSQDDSRWLAWVQDDYNVYKYLIRAYVHIPTLAYEDQVVELLPGRFQLLDNYPNPFNPVTNISYYLPYSEFIDLAIYNLGGQLVEQLVSEKQPAGLQTINWDARNLSSGVYFYRIKAGAFEARNKCLLLK